MQISDFVGTVNKILPPETAMSFDKVGLQLQSGNTEVSKILVAYEIIPEIVDEAIALHADMIFAFHPLIFNPMTNICEDERQGWLVTKLIKHGISVFIAHTNFDAYKFGTSRLLADKLDLETTGFLLPDANYPNTGMGTVAEVKGGAISESELLDRVKSVCGSILRYNLTGRKIKKVALLGGSGFSFINEVYANNCDAFITGDCSYHRFHEVFGKVFLIDAGHNETEKFVAGGIYDLLCELFKNENIKPVLATTSKSPVSTW